MKIAVEVEVSFTSKDISRSVRIAAEVARSDVHPSLMDEMQIGALMKADMYLRGELEDSNED